MRLQNTNLSATLFCNAIYARHQYVFDTLVDITTRFDIFLTKGNTVTEEVNKCAWCK